MEQHEIGTRKDLAAYRLKTAEEDLSSAELLLNHGDFRGANNRAYYAVFMRYQQCTHWMERRISATRMLLGILIRNM